MIGLYIISHLFSVADSEILEGFRGKTKVSQTNPPKHKYIVKEYTTDTYYKNSFLRFPKCPTLWRQNGLVKQ